MMSIFEELILELHIGHSKSRNMGGRMRIEIMAISSCSYLVWAGVGRALLSSLLAAVTAAVINPLNGVFLLCFGQQLTSPQHLVPLSEALTALWICSSVPCRYLFHLNHLSRGGDILSSMSCTCL